MRNLLVLLAASLVLPGCTAGYALVSPGMVAVSRGTMKVQPSLAWNKATRNKFGIPEEEHWTQNGPLLDDITFIGGLKDGQAITKQRPKDDRKVPEFRSAMTPQDFVSMVESYYRIKAGATVFETAGAGPGTLAGQSAVRVDFRFVGPDEIKRRGRALLAVVDGRLYFMSLDGAALHYFDAALPEFESMVGSVTIEK